MQQTGQKSPEANWSVTNLFDEEETSTEKADGTIRADFQSDALSGYKKAVNEYIRLIVLRCAPFEIVEDNNYRLFACVKTVTTAEIVKETILKLVELVKKRIANELPGTVGAVMFDGWSKFGKHYVAMIALYMKDVPSTASMKRTPQFQQRLALIVLSPMAKIHDKSDEKAVEKDPLGSESNDDVLSNDAETDLFNAETHLKFFRDYLEFFGCSFDRWCQALIVV